MAESEDIMSKANIAPKELSVISINAAQFIQGQFEDAVEQYGVVNTAQLFADALAEVYCPALPTSVIVKVGGDKPIERVCK